MYSRGAGGAGKRANERKRKGEKNVEQEWEGVIVEGRKQGRIRPKYEITLHPCGLRKKFKTAISIKFNLAQVSNQALRRNETGGLPPGIPCKSLTSGPRGPQLKLPLRSS